MYKNCGIITAKGLIIFHIYVDYNVSNNKRIKFQMHMTLGLDGNWAQ
jgi:hypothetical protein